MKIFLLAFFWASLISSPSSASIFVEPGAGILWESSKFHQNNATQSYEHDGQGVGAEVFARAGFGIRNLRFGATGSITKLSERHRRRSNLSIPDYATYSGSFNQKLFGPYFGLLSPGGGARFFGEYYTYAARNVTYYDGDNKNPFHKYDQEHGYGWGIGMGIYRSLFGSSLLYRNLRFNEYDFKNYENRTDLSNQIITRQQIHEIIFQISIPFDTAGWGGGKDSGGDKLQSGKGDAGLFETILKSLFKGGKSSK